MNIYSDGASSGKPISGRGLLQELDGGQILIKADRHAWQRTLGYIPSAVDVRCSRHKVRIKTGLENRLYAVARDSNAYMVMINEPSKALKRLATSATHGHCRIDISGGNGQMVLRPERTSGSPYRGQRWARIGAIASLSMLVPSAILLSLLLKGYLPMANTDITLMQHRNIPRTNTLDAKRQGHRHGIRSSGEQHGILHHGIKMHSAATHQSETRITRAQAAALVKNASGNRAHLVKLFRDPHSHMTGVVLAGDSKSAHTTIGWLTDKPPRKLMLGSVFTSDGTELTKIAAAKYDVSLSVAGNSQTKVRNGHASGKKVRVSAPVLYKALATKRFATISAETKGNGDIPLYVFFDPNCSYCHHLWQTISKSSASFRKHHVAVHFVPVAIVSESSQGKAAALLRGGIAALRHNERHYDASTEQGGVHAIHDKKLIRKVDENTRLLFSDGHEPASPTIVWQDHFGKAHVIVGDISHQALLQILGEIKPI